MRLRNFSFIFHFQLNSGLRLFRSSQQAKPRNDVGTHKITNYELRFLSPIVNWFFNSFPNNTTSDNGQSLTNDQLSHYRLLCWKNEIYGQSGTKKGCDCR